MQNSSISHCPYGQRHTSASLLPCSSSHGVGVQERPAVTAGEPSMEFRTKASPPPQGGIQPWLPKIPPPPQLSQGGYCIPSPGFGKDNQRQRVYLTASLIPTCTLGRVTKMWKFRLSSSGNGQKELPPLYFPVNIKSSSLISNTSCQGPTALPAPQEQSPSSMVPKPFPTHHPRAVVGTGGAKGHRAVTHPTATKARQCFTPS